MGYLLPTDAVIRVRRETGMNSFVDKGKDLRGNMAPGRATLNYLRNGVKHSIAGNAVGGFDEDDVSGLIERIKAEPA